MRVEINPELLRWACERADLTIQLLSQRLPALPAWVNGEKQPTLKQLEKFAKIVHVPIGYLFLPKPPKETLPVPDFRTAKNYRINRPSSDLLETLYLCQQRQEWYREFSRIIGETPLDFVGSLSTADDPVLAAEKISSLLQFSMKTAEIQQHGKKLYVSLLTR